MNKDKFLTLEEARATLNVSERSMYRYIHSGKLKAYKMGQWRIKEKDLQDYIIQSSYIPKKKS